MRIAPGEWRGTVLLTGLGCTVCLLLAGCNDVLTNSGVAHPGNPATESQSASPAVAPESDGSLATPDSGNVVPGDQAPASNDALVDPSRPRSFAVEGSQGALRISFDDLDLLKLVNMDVVTSDCVERMPEWLRGLDGKRIRIRGFMKPGLLTEGMPEFVFVRSTDMCCFGPKGKVYHMIAVMLKPPVTTDYIPLRPFDVEGTFHIEKVELVPGTVFLLYHLEDAAIIRN
jgi:hypothetical protein